ncbi:MAG: isochorismatase family protein [Neisseria sp.]|nr:isochorismatase family protein [Neisseria sp.]
MSIVAIDVDAQCTFTPLCPQELPVPEGDKIVAELNAQAALANLRVLTKDAHSAHAVWAVERAEDSLQPLDFPDADLTWRRHAEVGTLGFEALPGLPRPQDYDFLVYKGVEKDMHPYGACFHDLNETISTGLIEWLRDQQAQTIIVGGLATDYCVKNTVLQLCRHGSWQVVVNLAACRGIADDTTAAALEAMRAAGARIVDSSQDIKL